MSPTALMTPSPSAAEAIRHRWGWFVALGIVLVALGLLALGASALTTLVSVLFFGWLLIVGGVMQAVHAFSVRRWAGFLRHLFGGLLAVVVGVLLVGNPAAGALSLTLVMAAFFLVGGLFRIGTALTHEFP